MKVNEVMLTLGDFPIVKEKAILKEALTEMANENLGLVCIVDGNNFLKGLITDGDLRRNLLKIQKPFSAFFVDDAINHSNLNPITCKPHDELKHIVKLMGEKLIWDLPVIGENGELKGLLHLHPAIKKLLKYI